jgi:hypothetical protein
MAKDKDRKISELPGIAQGAVVALNRIGILTAADLVGADFDRVAYVVEDFDEATRLTREARKAVDGRRKAADTPTAPGPIASGNATPQSGKPAMKVSEWARTVAASTPAPSSRPAPRPGSAKPPHAAPNPANTSAVGTALAIAAATSTSDESDDWRITLRRRLGAVSMLLDHHGSEDEVAAALLLESVEGGEVATETTGAMGPSIERLLEECLSLRAVPVLPSGKLPRYYLEMAKESGLPARRICASYIMAALEHEPEAPGPELAKVAEALLAGSSDDLLKKLGALMEGMHRAAA